LRFHGLLPARLSDLAPDHFVGVLDPLGLVRIGDAQLPDLGGRLADLLPVGAGDGDLPGLRFEGDRDPFGNREVDRVRIADREDDGLAFDFRLVADADDLQVLGEALVTPSTELATRLRRRPWNARSCGWSPERAMRISPSSIETVRPGGMRLESSPLGPLTFRRLPSLLTSTPFGITTGIFPMRDTSYLP
jgi:hypothetical protein